MSITEQLIERVSAIIKKHGDLVAALIALFAFAIRIYFYDPQVALWWDEADYLSLAKHYGLGTPHMAAPWRARAFSMFLGLFYYLGANEVFMKIFWIIMASFGVYLTYIIGKKFYSKWAGILAAIMLSVYYEYVFWSLKIAMGIFALIIWCLIIMLFWDGYIEKKKKSSLIISGALLGYGMYAYETAGFLILFIGLFLLMTERLAFLKNEKFWIFALAITAAAAPFAMLNYSEFHGYFGEKSNILYEIYPRFGNFATADFDDSNPNNMPDWKRPLGTVIKESFILFTSLTFLFKWPFLLLLLIGLLNYSNLFFGIDLAVKGKNKKLKKDLYFLLWPLSIMMPMGIVIATTGFILEPRFITPALPALFIIAGRGVIKTYNYIKKYHKLAALAAVILLLSIGIYLQLTTASNLIQIKKEAYAMERPAGEWIKSHTSANETIAVCNQGVPFVYYTERKILSLSKNSTHNLQLIKKEKPEYFIFNLYPPPCDYETYQFANSHPEIFKPAQVYFIDKEKKKPVIIIYQINSSSQETDKNI